MGKKKGKGGNKPLQTEEDIPDYLLAEQDLLEVAHESDSQNNAEDVNKTGSEKSVQNDNNSQNNENGTQTSTGNNKETKGQMLQRHKKELKDLKQQTQEMLHNQEKHDKKSKQQLMDNIKKMEDDLKAKHEKELQSIDEEENEITQGMEDMMQKKDSQSQKSNKKKAKKVIYDASWLSLQASKQSQELEREKRIAMEKANQVSMKDVENNMFAKKLHPMQLTIKQVPSDGNCLYAAVADQLASSGHPTTKDYYKTLRRMTAEYMRKHPDDFLPFIDHEDGIMSEQQYAEYCDNVANTSCWGGQLELRALVHALQTPILIYSAEPNVPTVEMGKEFEPVGKPLQLSYVRCTNLANVVDITDMRTLWESITTLLSLWLNRNC